MTDLRQTTHNIVAADSRSLDFLADESIDVIVTSPPYPMITMWDDIFRQLSDDIGGDLAGNNGMRAFEGMHIELDKVWRECYRVLKPGCFACVNIGDAVRKIGDNFRLYSNHSRIIKSFTEMGFDCLPAVIWRKQTNAPNKFMGSGMLPCGAYTTLEHEFILIFRKGDRKAFRSEEDRQKRMRSAFFWEERNVWFSDVWDFKGTRQELAYDDKPRTRSAAFPFELPWRIINMYSLYGDTVLDPFAGTGTSILAAISAGRNSIGVDVEKALTEHIAGRIESFASEANTPIFERTIRHIEFVKKQETGKRPLRHTNKPHGFKVMTLQETELQLNYISDIRRINNDSFTASYEPFGNLATEELCRKAVELVRAIFDQQTRLIMDF